MDKNDKQLKKPQQGTWKEFKEDLEQQLIYKEHARLISQMYKQYAKT